MIVLSGPRKSSERSGLQRLKYSGSSVLCIIVMLIAAGPIAFAQAGNTGTVAGNITDQQGSAVVEAVATLSSPDQGKSFTAKANTKGEYLFSDIPVGTYNLTVTAPSFRTSIINSISVEAAQNVRLDAHLDNGTTTESVTVEAASTTLDTRSRD